MTYLFSSVNVDYEKGNYKINEAQQILKEKQLKLGV